MATNASDSPVCLVLAKVVNATAPRDIAWIPGAGVNALLGLTTGGFPADSYVLQFRVSQEFNTALSGRDELVRLAMNEGSARGGSWWTPLEFVADANGRLLPLVQIEDLLALPA